MPNLRALKISRNVCTLFAELRGRDTRALPGTTAYTTNLQIVLNIKNSPNLKSSHIEKKNSKFFYQKKKPESENLNPKILPPSPSLEIRSTSPLRLPPNLEVGISTFVLL